MVEELNLSVVPQHVAIIMDGNGRWAKQRGLPRLAGHRAGTENLRSVIETFAEYGVKYLTLYAFSTENWGRPRVEIKGLFRILSEVVGREVQNLKEKGVKLRHLGKLEGLPQKLQESIQRAIELTQENDKLVLSIAFNYGGRAEIIEAVKRLIADGIPPERINESLFHNYLYTAGLPDPDLIIRTAGEMRLSNFLIWQSAYSEYYFTPVFWPDFGKEEIEKVLVAYSQRERRFGRLRPQKAPPVALSRQSDRQK